MAEKPRPRLSVMRKEPLIRAIAATGLRPAGLGIAFFLLVSLPLCLWAVLAEPGLPPPGYVSFLENISWSISIVFIFPFVVALTLRYYLEIPELFEFLRRKAQEEGAADVAFDDFNDWLDRRFNSYWVTGVALALSLGLNAVYFFQILHNQQFAGWMSTGDILGSVAPAGRGLTAVGLFAAVIQVVLIYWVANLVWRGLVLAWGLHDLFNRRGVPIEIQPLHPDRCCGLRKIGEVAMLLNLTLFAIGIYLSLKVIDKIVVQDADLTVDIGNPLMLGAYLILAPLLFFFPLGAAHRRMSESRELFLRPLSQECERLAGELRGVTLDQQGLAAIQTFSALDASIMRLHREIPVWPFDFRSLQAFIGTIVVPVLPVLLPFAVDLIFGW